MIRRHSHDTLHLKKPPVERKATQEQVVERQQQVQTIGHTAAMLSFMEQYDADGDNDSRGGVC